VVNDPARPQQVANTIMATGGSGKERNLIFQPVPDYNNLVVPGKHSPINSRGIRIMTPTEWGRLQGFIGYAFLDKEGKDHFSFPAGVTEGQQYKQFGNSVSIPVIAAIAKYIVERLKLMDNMTEVKKTH
jgi:DNA (cytosine-5)-methyltransferase 1